MISEKTITTWMSEFTRIGKSKDGQFSASAGSEIFEYMVMMQANFLSNEPIFSSMMISLLNVLDIKDPIAIATYVMGMYHELELRQKEADALEEQMKK